MLKIKTNRLLVEIDDKFTEYEGYRFDRTGIISQVILDEKYTYCSSEIIGKSIKAGGIGICSEFGLNEALGYDELPIGESFLKIGVGDILKNSKDPYFSWGKYSIDKDKIEVYKKDNKIIYFMNQRANNGYSINYTKEIEVFENCINIKYEVKNTGLRSVSINEYSHNFLRIGDKNIGKDYSLEVPCKLNEIDLPQIFNIHHNEITWKYTPDTAFYLGMDNLNNEMKNSWKLIDRETGANVTEFVDRDICRFALWGQDHVVSPELFIKLYIKPWEKETWNRKFLFNCK